MLDSVTGQKHADVLNHACMDHTARILHEDRAGLQLTKACIVHYLGDLGKPSCKCVDAACRVLASGSTRISTMSSSSSSGSSMSKRSGSGAGAFSSSSATSGSLFRSCKQTTQPGARGLLCLGVWHASGYPKGDSAPFQHPRLHVTLGGHKL